VVVAVLANIIEILFSVKNSLPALDMMVGTYIVLSSSADTLEMGISLSTDQTSERSKSRRSTKENSYLLRICSAL
jgi:hypothetical protein